MSTTALAPYEMAPPLLATVKATTPTQLIDQLDDDFLGLVAATCFKGKCCSQEGWKPAPKEMQELLWKAHRSGLDPFLDQIVGVYRYSQASSRYELAVQTTAEGYGAIAELSGDLVSISPPRWDRDEDGKPPRWCEVTVTRILHGREAPFTFRAHYSEFYRDSTPAWKTMPWHMLALRAECHAIKKAFRLRTSGLSLPASYQPRGEALDVEFEERDEPNWTEAAKAMAKKEAEVEAIKKAVQPEPEPEPEQEKAEPEAPRRAPPPVLGGAR